MIGQEHRHGEKGDAPLASLVNRLCLLDVQGFTAQARRRRRFFGGEQALHAPQDLDLVRGSGEITCSRNSFVIQSYHVRFEEK